MDKNEKKIRQIEDFLSGYKVKIDKEKEETLRNILIEKKIDLNLKILAEELTKLGLNE